MFFQKVYILRDKFLDDGETFESSTISPFSITLQLRPPLEGEEPNLKKEDCLGILRTEEDVSAEARLQFEIIKEPQPAVYEIMTNLTNRLDEYLRQTVTVLRWRRGKTGHSNPIHASRDLDWSDDGQNWKRVPNPIVGLHIGWGIPWTQLTEAVRESVTNLLKTGVSEPLAHELFHEAWSLRTDNPRSSLIIGIAAAEVGIKSLIGLLVPDAEWLAFNSPSPPIDKILRSYLPQLPTKLTFDAAPFIPQNVLKILREAVEYRNQTTHTGKTKDPISADTLKGILVAVRDLLYILDVYSGHDWAFRNVGHVTRESIQAEVQKQKGKASNKSAS